MSEPVTSMDVEDVLSSIRRLVSEEAKGNAEDLRDTNEDSFAAIDENIHEAAENAARDAIQDVARQVMGEDFDSEMGEDEDEEIRAFEPPSNEFALDFDVPAESAQKLVLTEALRVSDEIRIQDDAKEEAVFAEDKADLAAANESNPPEAVTNVRPLRPSKFDASPEDSLFERAKEAMDEVQVKHARPQRRVNFVRTEPDMVEDSASMLTEESREIEAEVANEIDAELVSTSQGTVLSDALADDGVAEIDAGDFDQTPVDPSPFAAEAAGFAEQVDEFVEDAEVIEEVSAETFADEPSAEDDEASTINFAEEDSILDEETLRDMVSELVRSELQGELGDRITRNVRKLVRREIQRALSTREFE